MGRSIAGVAGGSRRQDAHGPARHENASAGGHPKIRTRSKSLYRFAGLVLAATAALAASAQAQVKTLTFGWTVVVPATIVLKEKGWLEAALKPRGISVAWVESDGSNRTLEFIRSRSIDFGSSAASAALLGRANGTPVKIIYFSLRGESTALLTQGNSTLKTIADLKGHKVAATRGTEPFIFLLRALKKNGIPANDVEIVPLQHPDGRVALETGRVDAWAALDPDFSIALNHGARFLYRDQSLITGGVLDVREDFAKEAPDLVVLVLQDMERARAYIHAHPDKVLRQFAASIHQPLNVARAVFNRADIDHPAIRPEDYTSIAASGEILKQIDAIPANTDLQKVTAALLDPSYFKKVEQK